MEISFHGKRALVTGASRGIGRGIAVALAKAGAEVFALARSEDALKTLCAEQANIRAVVCDLMDAEKTQGAVKAILPIHLLVNNSGTSHLQPLVEADLEAFDEIFRVNVKAPFILSQMIANDLIARDLKGSIVNVSSISAKMSMKGIGLYSSSKAALDGLTRSFAREVGPNGIRVNSIAPQLVKTELTIAHFGEDLAGAKAVVDRVPLGRAAQIDEMVPMTLFLLSDHASMVNGSYIPIDGGYLSAGP